MVQRNKGRGAWLEIVPGNLGFRTIKEGRGDGIKIKEKENNSLNIVWICFGWLLLQYYDHFNKNISSK